MRSMYPSGIADLFATEKLVAPPLRVAAQYGLSLSAAHVFATTEINQTTVAEFAVYFESLEAKALYTGFSITPTVSGLTGVQSDLPDGAIKITLTFSPTVADNRTVSIVLHLSATDFKIAVPLTLTTLVTGTLTTDGVEVVNFASTEINAVNTNTLTLRNSATVGNVTISSAVFKSLTGFDFTISNNLFPITLTPNQTYVLTITFRPTANTLRTGTVNFYDAADTPLLAQEVVLQGSGTLLGSTQPTAIVTFEDLPVFYTDAQYSGIGKMCQTFKNLSQNSFVITSYIFNDANAAIENDYLLTGMVISPNEVLQIQVAYTKVVPATIPLIQLFGYYV